MLLASFVNKRDDVNPFSRNTTFTEMGETMKKLPLLTWQLKEHTADEQKKFLTLFMDSTKKRCSGSVNVIGFTAPLFR
jgi:hypothetical protein